LCRVVKLTTIKFAFVWCSLLLIIILAMPRVGGSEHLWMNGLYDSLTIIILFPLIVFLGASGHIKTKAGSRVSKFMADISYPIYITHYPLIYIYTGWAADHKPTFQQALPFALLTFFASIVLAYACFKWYDEPVRRWLKNKFLVKSINR
jgi:peptidoglycan/LPS O-acetylase OafA/YrhL